MRRTSHNAAAAVERERTERIGIGQQAQRAFGQRRAAGKVLDGGERPRRTRRRQPPGPFDAEAIDLAQAETQREVIGQSRRFARDACLVRPILQRRPLDVLPAEAGHPPAPALKAVVPDAGVDVDRPHRDAVLDRIADQLRWGVEAHRAAS